MADRPATDSPAHEDLARIREQAADWIVRLEDAEAGQRERLQAQCEAWQAVDPRRRQVLAQMQQMWSAVTPAPARRRRAAGLAVFLLLAGTLATQLPWESWTADYRTTAGEIREITLPDGSAALLDSNSAIDVDYGAGRRSVRLARGQLVVTVRPDPGERPFHVLTGHGSAVALGTRYSVRLEAQHAVVTVHESRVRLVPRTGGSAKVLKAGERAVLEPDGVGHVEPAKRTLPDWTDRRLVFNDAPLSAVVERLARYRPGWLRLDDELSGRDLHFTGVLPADDSDTALAVLADALPLQIRRLTPYLVWVEPAD